MVEILVADDHPIMRGGLRQIVAEIADIVDIVVNGEASNGEEILAKLEYGQFDVLVLDLSMVSSMKGLTANPESGLTQL